MDVCFVIWFLLMHGINVGVFLSVTRFAAGRVKTFLGLAVFLGVVACIGAIARRTGCDPSVYAPYTFPVGFAVWLGLAVALSPGHRARAVFACVLSAASQIALATVCYALMLHSGPDNWMKILAIVLQFGMGAYILGWAIPRVWRISPTVDWRILDVGVILLLIMVYVSGHWPIRVPTATRWEMLPFVVSVLALVSFFPIVFHLSAKSSAAAARLKLVEDNMQILMDELRAVRASEEGVRRVRHDAHHHVDVVREMLAAGRVAEIEEYLANLSDHEVLGSSGVRRWCDNTLVNALFAVADRKAAAQGRRFTATADVPAVSPLNEADIVALFGNLLENAIRHGAPGEIRVTLALDGGNVLRLSVANAVPPGFALVNGLPAKAEGVGLTVIRQVVEKYHGVKGYEVTGNELICKVVIGCA